eukprot:1136670-Pelagomonas_calceolata.AAC.10
MTSTCWSESFVTAESTSKAVGVPASQCATLVSLAGMRLTDGVCQVMREQIENQDFQLPFSIPHCKHFSAFSVTNCYEENLQ